MCCSTQATSISTRRKLLLPLQPSPQTPLPLPLALREQLRANAGAGNSVLWVRDALTPATLKGGIELPLHSTPFTSSMHRSPLLLALLLCAVLSLPAPAGASSQVALVLFFCSVAAVVPGPWQQPLTLLSSQKDSLVPELSFFALRLLLMTLVASLLQKLARCDAQKFASLSLYATPAMSLALLVDQAHRQPWIDALSLASTAKMMYNAFRSALPAACLEAISHAFQLPQLSAQLFQRWSTGEIGESVVITESNRAVLLSIACALALLLLFRILWAAFSKCIASVDSMALKAILVSQLSASFVLSRVPDLRSASVCMLCVIQLCTAPYLRHRSLPLPTEKNRRLFIVCVLPIAMAYSSQGVELSVLIQAVGDICILAATPVKMSYATSNATNPKHHNNLKFQFYVIVASRLIAFLTILDIVFFRFAESYISELVRFSFLHTFQPDLTFISMFVLSWCANYNAGFPLLLVIVITVLLPSLKG